MGHSPLPLPLGHRAMWLAGQCTHVCMHAHLPLCHHCRECCTGGGIAMNFVLRASGGAPHSSGTLPQTLCRQRHKQQVVRSASLTQGQQCEPCTNVALLWAVARASCRGWRDPHASDSIATSLAQASHKCQRRMVRMLMACLCACTCGYIHVCACARKVLASSSPTGPPNQKGWRPLV